MQCKMAVRSEWWCGVYRRARKQKSREWWALLASGVGSLKLDCRALDAERAAGTGVDPGKLD